MVLGKFPSSQVALQIEIFYILKKSEAKFYLLEGQFSILQQANIQFYGEPVLSFREPNLFIYYFMYYIFLFFLKKVDIF